MWAYRVATPGGSRDACSVPRRIVTSPFPASQAPIEDTLKAIAAEQEQATAHELMASMDSFVAPGTAEYFMCDSGALPRETCS